MDSLQAAMRLARRCTGRGRDKLSLGPTGWDPGRVKEKHLKPRVAEALRHYAIGISEEEIASTMGLRPSSLECLL